MPAVGAGLIVALSAGSGAAQSLEPRAYSPAPVGLNFAVLGFTHSKGGLSVDPSLPLTDAEVSIPGTLLGYVRTIDFLGKSGKVDLIVPYGDLSGSAIYRGEPVERNVQGFGDPLARVSVSLYGAPALSPEAFRSYRQDLVIAASLQVSVPLGQYDSTRLLNLGANRWSIKPEIGLSKVFGPLTVEVAAAATFFGSNDDFFGGATRTQEPIYSAQGHLIYNLRSGIWASVNATYFTGGETRVDGASNRNLQSNWRLGVTAAIPVTRRISLKFSGGTGISARTGNNFDLLAVAWQYRWGGGI